SAIPTSAGSVTPRVAIAYTAAAARPAAASPQICSFESSPRSSIRYVTRANVCSTVTADGDTASSTRPWPWPSGWPVCARLRTKLQIPTVSSPPATPASARVTTRRPPSQASQASTGQTRTVVSFVPTPSPSATPASTASTSAPARRKHTAAAGNDAATRSFCAVVDCSETARGAVDGDEDRQLGDELRQRKEGTASGCDEQEQDLLLRERLELVVAAARRVRDPVDAAVLLPRRRARQVIGERVPVVRRHDEREHQLVAEDDGQPREEDERERVACEVADRRTRRRERRARAAAYGPRGDGCTQENELGAEQPRARH